MNYLGQVNNPVLEVNINGTFRTDDFSEISSLCSDGYRSELRTSGTSAGLEANIKLIDQELCSNLTGDPALSAVDMSLSTLREYVSKGIQSLCQ